MEQEQQRKSWTNERLWVLIPEQFDSLPDGTKLVTVNGVDFTKGVDKIDNETRGGYLGVGFPDGSVPANMTLTHFSNLGINARAEAVLEELAQENTEQKSMGQR
jgi:hypothetical protein